MHALNRRRGRVLRRRQCRPDVEGISFRGRHGTRVPLVMTMFLEGKTQERLTVLAVQRGHAGANIRRMEAIVQYQIE